jgi:hypothetical protein
LTVAVLVLLGSLLGWLLWRVDGHEPTRSRALPSLLLACAFSIAALNAYIGVTVDYIGGWDFLNGYYHAGSLLLRDAAPLLYERTGPVSVGGFVNLPIVAALFVPFAALPRSLSLFAFTLFGCGLCVWTAWLLTRGATQRQRLHIAVLFAVFGPLLYGISMGNTTHLLLPIVLAHFAWSDGRRDVLLGVLLALAVAIKPLLAMLAVYYVLRGRWRLVTAFTAGLLGTFVLSVLVFGLELNLNWWRFLSHFGSQPVSGYNNQSIAGALVRLLQDPNPFGYVGQPASTAFTVSKLLVTFAVVGFALLVFVRVAKPHSPTEERLELAITLCLAIVIAPISWTYYYALLLVPYGFYCRGALGVPQGRGWNMSILASLVLLFPPVHMITFSGGFLGVVYHRLLISHYLLGGVVLLAALLCARLSVHKTGAATPARYPAAAAS